MELLITIVGGVFVGLITTEIISNVPRISKWLIGSAALRLPDHARDHYREEWLAHLVPRHVGFDWLRRGQCRSGKCSGSTSISMLRATPGCRRMNPARSSVSTI